MLKVTTKLLIKHFTRILNLYLHAGKYITVMDGEFERVQNTMPMTPISITVAMEHVEEIERRTRVMED